MPSDEASAVDVARLVPQQLGGREGADKDLEALLAAVKALEDEPIAVNVSRPGRGWDGQERDREDGQPTIPPGAGLLEQ